MLYEVFLMRHIKHHAPLSLPDMLQTIDTTLAQATSNKAYDARIPLLDTTFKDIVSLASVFTSALFEFFVIVEPFEDRGKKSLVIRG